MGNIVAVLSFCRRDLELTHKFLDVAERMGPCAEHDCVLVTEGEMPWSKLYRVKCRARNLFRSVAVIQTNPPTPQGWPAGPNAQFDLAAKYMETIGRSWLWIEPDCIPLRRGWLNTIEAEYDMCHQPFLGSIHGHGRSGYLTGVAVYPPSAFETYKHRRSKGMPFDTEGGRMATLHAAESRTIQNRTTGTEYDRKVDRACVLYHRDKTGKLHDQIREAPNAPEDLTVVITAWQRPDRLKLAFRSCLEAGVRNIIITATGVTDQMSTVLDQLKYEFPFVVIQKHKDSVTANQSWFLGVEAANTTWAAILHDDDLLLPSYGQLAMEGIACNPPFIVLAASHHGVPAYIDSISKQTGVLPSAACTDQIMRQGGLSLTPIRGIFKRDDLSRWLRMAESLPKECVYRPGFVVGNDLLIWLQACDEYEKCWHSSAPGVSCGHWEGSLTCHDLGHTKRLFGIYDTTRRWWAQKKSGSSMNLEILTIVLDGMPLLAYHLPVFNRLTIPWHWHIVEGAAMNTHCTKWCKTQKPRLSTDGTTAFLDELAVHPRITIYRKEQWDGKIEMVNAPLSAITSECVLLEVDSDEFWTSHQLETLVRMFRDNPSKTHAMFWCRYFFGPHLVMEDRNCYGNTLGQDWKRAWRFRPGLRFERHEPPIMQQEGAGFSQEETEKFGLVFDHYGYFLKKQLAYKQQFYGYANATKCWEHMQRSLTAPTKLSDWLPWVASDRSGVVKAIS